MLYGEIKEYLKTFIEYDTLNEKFDYSINNESSPDIYLKEFKKFNNTYTPPCSIHHLNLKNSQVCRYN